jgi:hypothetical protein
MVNSRFRRFIESNPFIYGVLKFARAANLAIVRAISHSDLHYYETEADELYMPPILYRREEIFGDRSHLIDMPYIYLVDGVATSFLYGETQVYTQVSEFVLERWMSESSEHQFETGLVFDDATDDLMLAYEDCGYDCKWSVFDDGSLWSMGDIALKYWDDTSYLEVLDIILNGGYLETLFHMGTKYCITKVCKQYQYEFQNATGNFTAQVRDYWLGLDGSTVMARYFPITLWDGNGDGQPIRHSGRQVHVMVKDSGLIVYGSFFLAFFTNGRFDGDLPFIVEAVLAHKVGVPIRDQMFDYWDTIDDHDLYDPPTIEELNAITAKWV